MKKEIDGKKIQNWHRPLGPSDLRQRYLKKMDEDVEYTDKGQLREHPIETKKNYADQIRRYEDGWKQAGISLDEYFAKGYDEYEFICCIDCTFDLYGLHDHDLEDLEYDTLFDELLGLNRPIALSPLVTGHGHHDDGETPSPDILEQLVDLVDRIDEHRSDEPILIDHIAQAIGDLHNIDVLQTSIHDKQTLRSVLYFAPFWLRSPMTWNPKSDTPLLVHLFCHYETPAFLHDLRSLETAIDYKWLLWLIVLGQGGSLKRAGERLGWHIPTKSVQYLYDAPKDISKVKATMFAEIKRLGGSAEDHKRIIRHPAYVEDLSSLGSPTDPMEKNRHAFWQETVRWLIVNRDLITDAQSQEILDWASHEYTEAERTGNSHFSWKGRKLHNILERSEEYRHQLEREREQNRLRQELAFERYRLQREGLLGDELERELERYYLRLEQGYTQYEWEPHDLDWEYVDHRGARWNFVELTTGVELYREGERMHHCVSAYALGCSEGRSTIVSVRLEGVQTLTIEIVPETLQLRQVYGAYNRRASLDEQNLVEFWKSELARRKSPVTL